MSHRGRRAHNTGVLTCRPASPIKLLTKSTARASLELKYVLELKQGCESVEILRIPLAPELRGVLYACVPRTVVPDRGARLAEGS